MSCTRDSIASATTSGVTVRQVITRSTGAAASPRSKPALSHSVASDKGAIDSSVSTTLATVSIGEYLITPDRHANQHHDQQGPDRGEKIVHEHCRAVAL